MKINFILLIAFLLTACGKKITPPLHATRICVLYEAGTAPAPLPVPILSLFDFKSDSNQQADFQIALLVGRLLNPTQAIHLDNLPNIKKANDEEKEQHSEIAASFCRSAHTAIADFPKEYVTASPSKPRFECYASIAEQLELLSGSDASQRYLLVFGSLKEIEPAFNSNSDEDRKLFANNPKKVACLLEKRRKMPINLVGVSVYFIFQPATENEAQWYSLAASFYRDQLRMLGARIVIQSSALNLQP